jgi:glycosyltransferase involved in cell wall biosynthesis
MARASGAQNPHRSDLAAETYSLGSVIEVQRSLVGSEHGRNQPIEVNVKRVFRQFPAHRSRGPSLASCLVPRSLLRRRAQSSLMRKRIVLLSPGHSEPGGAAVRSRILAQTFAERGWEVRAITRAGTQHRFRFNRSSAVTVLEVPGFGRTRIGGALFAAVAAPLGIFWGARASAFVAIRLASPATVAALCGLLVRRPYIALTTSSGRLSELQYVLSTRGAALRRRVLRRAAFLVAQTDAAAAELETLVPRERIAVVPNPVAAVKPTPLNGLPHVLYTGRLSSEKDLTRLLAAWRSIVAELPGARLTLVGAGGAHRSVERELRNTAEADPLLRGTVSFTGWVEDVTQYLRRTDVYVFPSLEEGMSNALLEACAWRRVIVASDIPPNRAVLGDDFPLVFRAGDTDDLVHALRRALTDDLVREQAQQLLEARVREASPDAVVARLEKLIDASRRSR